MRKYLPILSFTLLNIYNPCMASHLVEEDEAFNAAIQASLQQQTDDDIFRQVLEASRQEIQSQPISNTPDDEDEDILLALALSMQEPKPAVDIKEARCDHDHALAETLQKQETLRHQQDDSDYLYALQLQENPQFGTQSFEEIQRTQKKQNVMCDLVMPEQLSAFINIKSSYDDWHTKMSAKLTDVHVFNKGYVVQTRDNILAINKALGLNKDWTPQQVLDGINTWGMKQHYPNFDKSFTQLLTHLKTAAIDPETGVNVCEALSTCYSLSQLLTESEKSKLCFFIDQNITEEGGCFGGFAGRLFLTNTAYLYTLLGQ